MDGLAYGELCGVKLTYVSSPVSITCRQPALARMIQAPQDPCACTSTGDVDLVGAGKVCDVRGAVQPLAAVLHPPAHRRVRAGLAGPFHQHVECVAACTGSVDNIYCQHGQLLHLLWKRSTVCHQIQHREILSPPQTETCLSCAGCHSSPPP